MKDYLTQLKSAKEASAKLRTASSKQKNLFLTKLAELLLANQEEILAVNAKDVNMAVGAGITKAMLSRLTLTDKIIASMADGLNSLAKQSDPVGKIEKMWRAANGLKVGKMRVPIGVIAFVFESRPNVIIDAAGICVKSGNALIARGGKEAVESNGCLVEFIQRALFEAGLPKEAAQYLEDRSYETFGKLLEETKYLDLVVPRGRESLIKSVKAKSRVPVIAHERGLCHIFVDAGANLEMARKIIVNAKISNPSTCNSVETILVHEDIADKLMPALITDLLSSGVEIRGDERVCGYNSACRPAAIEDWDTEYLDLILSIKTVKSFTEAVAHIEKHGSGLSDAIITENYSHSQIFLESVNSAAVLVNASNRLVDGGIFGLGAELGISTASIHMKGPMGLEDLTVTKFIVLGQGELR
ncbi:glutamate-5-semialdehyde dehydrogenase [Candidatus Falkowbacteria bacterium]|nr:glutamate-5-semialdehyde dehydrogenase [Candidatus Falkowbacteria bacterium]